MSALHRCDAIPNDVFFTACALLLVALAVADLMISLVAALVGRRSP